MFEQFQVGIYNFVLKAGPEGLDLPPFYGSTLRGAFGGAFKHIACANPRRESCHGCELERDCPYAYIFETSPPAEAERLKSYDDVPRPFMFFPKLNDKIYYRPGETLEVELCLFGRGNDYFPYFILAFIQMGERGLGARRKPFRLQKAASLNPIKRIEQVVYDGESNKVFQPKYLIEGKDIFSGSAMQFPLPVEDSNNNNIQKAAPVTENRKSQNKIKMKVQFLTPVRIKENGDLVTTVEFHHLARSLMRRASSIMNFHHGVNLDFNFTELAARSRLPKRVSDTTSWYDIERYSQRQGGKMKLGGVVGEVTYEGELAEFIPFLEFGRWCGAGKNCVFGLGQMDYVIVE